MSKLAVGIPITWEHVPVRFMSSYLQLFKPQRLQELARLGITNILEIFERSFPVDYNRNQICRNALELGCEYLLFLDTDMTFPPDMVPRLIGAGKDVISGVYFKKRPPYAPVPGMFSPGDPLGQHIEPIADLSGGLVRADVVGGGCLLIRRCLLEAVGQPWFSYEIDKRTGERSVTEDVGFCRRVLEKGFEIWVDTSIKCGHITSRIVTEEDHRSA